MTANRRPKVLLVYPIAPESVELLTSGGAAVATLDVATDEEIGEAIVDADAVITHGPALLTSAHLSSAPQLRVVAALGSGTDSIDVAAATELGIPVTSGAGVGRHSVAEWAIGAALALHRRILPAHAALVDGTFDWSSRLEEFSTSEFTGSVFGVVGFGHIGREVAKLAAAFDNEILVFDPHLPSLDDGMERCSTLAEMLERSATVSLHVPLNDDTRGLIGQDEVRAIGPQGVLVHMARGGVVDEAAVVEALLAGELGGAAFDVFAGGEPPRPEQIAILAQAPNLILSPHLGGATNEALRRLEANAVAAVLETLRGDRPRGLVNPAHQYATGATS